MCIHAIVTSFKLFHPLCSLLCFFKHKTAYEMRISDWSSDVCSSDLTDAAALTEGGHMPALALGGPLARQQGQMADALGRLQPREGARVHFRVQRRAQGMIP